MSEWFVILNDSSIPVFSKSLDGKSPPPSFAVVGLLSALHSSSKSQGCELLTMTSSTHRVSFLVREGLVFCLLSSSSSSPSSSSSSSKQSQLRLQCLYSCAATMLGPTVLQSAKGAHVKNAQRALKTCNDLFEPFLSNVSKPTMFAAACGLPELAIPSSSLLNEFVSAMAQRCGTSHAMLISGHVILACTHEWHELHPRDTLSISMLISVLPLCSARDVPVFLPHSSLSGATEEKGKTAYRLLVVSLFASPLIQLALLCRPQPSLTHVIQEVKTAVTSEMSAALRSCVSDCSRNIPSELKLPAGLRGLLFIQRNSVCSYLNHSTPPVSVGAIEPSTKNPTSENKISFSEQLLLCYHLMCEELGGFQKDGPLETICTDSYVMIGDCTGAGVRDFSSGTSVFAVFDSSVHSMSCITLAELLRCQLVHATAKANAIEKEQTPAAASSNSSSAGGAGGSASASS